MKGRKSMSVRTEELTEIINNLREELMDPSTCKCKVKHLQERLKAATKELVSLNEVAQSKDNLLKG
jgi:ribosomal protein L29